MEYCCDEMEDADSKEIVDYAPGMLVTIDSNDWAYPIDLCPWCGEEFENPTLDRIEKAASEYSNRKTTDKGEKGE